MVGALRGFVSLGPTNQRVLLRALAWSAVVDVALRLAAYRQRTYLAQPAPGTLGAVPTHAEVRRAREYAHWIEVAARHGVVRAHCLHRSIVLYHWLRREGLSCELQIGVLLDHGRLKAHAWVDMGGEPVADSPNAIAAFTRLRRDDAPASRRSG